MGRKVEMKITPDTNILVRAAVPVGNPTSEDGIQSVQAQAVLRNASVIAITLPTLCDFVWVLRSVYKNTKNEIKSALETLCSATSVTCDRQALNAGLNVLSHGGDFADGVTTSAGAAMGGTTFVSFDRQAVRILRRAGQNEVRLVSELFS
jgi:predicted nucleic-acid-binding protein